MASLDAAEEYAVSVGWQNGTVTDEEYLDMLRDRRNRAPEGSSDRISAQDKLEDAIYTIGRNKLVRGINNAPTDEKRIQAYRDLIAFDKAKLATMVGDNEQRRELVDRIAGAEADIRSTRWSALVRVYNQNQTSNQRMLAFAKEAAKQAQGAPDQQVWTDRVFEFSERIKDEHLEELKQDYDMDRVSGGTVLAFVNQRLKDMDKSSPRYADLNRWREDFAKAFHADEQAEKYAAKYAAYQEGRLSDDEWLGFLHQRVQDAPKGSEERRSAQHDVVMESFRIAENRITYNVAVNGAPVKNLITFYENALKTMDRGSGRALDIRQRIHDLKLQGVAGIDLGGASANPDHAGPGHTVGGDYTYNPSNPGNNGIGYGKGVAGAEAVISMARSYLGVDYKLGAESRNQVDCSGLLFRAFQDTGLGGLLANGERRRVEGIEAVARRQGDYFTNGKQAQRGDLVIYGNGEHIGIYLGNGKVLSALTSGVSIHRIYGIGQRVTGFVRPEYDGAQPITNPALNDIRKNNKNKNKGTGNTDYSGARTSGDGGSLATDRQEKPQRVKPGEEQYVTNPKRTTQGVGREGALGTTGTNTGTGTSQRESTPLPGATLQMAKYLLKKMGVSNPDDDQVRAVGAWLFAENGNTVSNNNPFNLQTGPGNPLQGQLGVDGSGYAIFNTWQQGMDAAADELQSRYPTIVQAFRQGNPQAILSSIEKSDWRPGGYGNTLIPTFNSTGPGKTVIGNGQNIFDTPPSMATLANRAPGIADLFDVNYADPAQKAWYDANLDNLEAAFQNYDPTGRRQPGQWVFINAAGNPVTLPFSPEMYYEMLKTKADMTGDSDDWEKLRTTRNDVTLEQFGSTVLNGQDQVAALLAAGDLTGAVRLSKSLLRAAADLLHIEGVDVDTALYTGHTFDNDELNAIQDAIDRLLPATDDNPTGNALLGLLDPNYNSADGLPPFVQDEATGKVKVNPNAAYFQQDLGTGKIVLVTAVKNPLGFIMDSDLAADGVTVGQVPHYKKSTIAIDIGADVEVRFTPQGESSLTIGVLDSGGYRNGELYGEHGQAGLAHPTTPTPPQLPGGQGTININPLMGNFITDQPSAGFSINTPVNTRMGGQQQQHPAPNLSPEDYYVRPGRGRAPIDVYKYFDLQSQRWLQAYTMDGGKTWMIAPIGQDGLADPPMPVLNADVMGKYVRFTDGGMEVLKDPNKPPSADNWVAYDPKTHGPVGQYFHWYGTDARDIGSNDASLGAANARYIVREGNGDGFNGSLGDIESIVIDNPSRRTVGDTYSHAAVIFAGTDKGKALNAQEERSQAAITAGYGLGRPKKDSVESRIEDIITAGKTEAARAADDRESRVFAGLAGLTGNGLSGSTTASTTRAVARTSLTHPSITAPNEYAAIVTRPPKTPTPVLGGNDERPAPRPAPAPYKPPTLPTTTPKPRPTPGPSYTPPALPTPKPTPQPAPAPNPNKPTLPGVSTRPRAPHEND